MGARLAVRRAATLAFAWLIVACGTAAEVGSQPAPVAPGALDAIREGDARRARGDERGAVDAFERALAADTGSATTRFRLAYALLAAGRTGDAISRFREGLARDGSYALGRRQLGYLYSAAGRPRQAIAEFRAADSLGAMISRDWYQLGIEYAWLGQNADARRSFERAAAVDTAVAREAGRAIERLDGNGYFARHESFIEAYAAPLYQSRFDIGIVDAIVRAGVVAAPDVSLTPYASVRVSSDTRSVVGARPLLYSDNTLIPAAGLRLRPLPIALTIYGEVGAAIPFRGDDARPTRSDLRAGTYYYAVRQHGRLSHSATAPFALRGESYADASYYSRFDDVIAYVSHREHLRLLDDDGRSIELYGRLGVVVDGRQLYYNNIVETAAGVAIYPIASRRAFLLAESMTGQFFRAPEAGVARRYHTLRATVVLSAYRSFAPRWR